MRLFVLILFAVVLVTGFLADPARAQDGKTRLTAGVPVFVWHDNERPASRDWNDGWFHNEGVFVDLSRPFWALGEHTDLRLGLTAGGFDNSIYRDSFFFGGMAEIESHLTDRFALQFGGYAGVLTGYDNDVGPGAAPYIGMSYAVTERVEIGLREFWLPAKTVAGSDVAPSDAYVSTVTVGTRF